MRRSVLPSAASGIDYLSIRLFVGGQIGEADRGGWGEFPPMGLFRLVLKCMLGRGFRSFCCH